ncbi:MAG: DNA translocase FtsK [Chloroflexi bacterium]|nr:DNA translocase FtsK [Chloroflexota bacterium]
MATRATKPRAASRRSGSAPTPASARWSALGGLAAVASIVVGCLSALALVFPDGSLTGPLHRWLRLGFGWSSPLVPLWLVAVGWLALRNRSSTAEARAARWPRVAGLAVFSLAAAPAAHLLPIGPASPVARAEGGLGGGWVGHVLAQVLLEALGGPASAVLLAGLLLAGALLALELSVAQVVSALVATARATWRLAQQLSRPTQQPAVRVNAPAGVAPAPRLPERLLRLLRGRGAGRDARPTGAASSAQEARPQAPPRAGASRWQLPPLSLFSPGSTAEASQTDVRLRARTIEETLASFNVEARVVEVNPGPTVTQFGLEPAPGVAVNRVLARSNDLALRLGASPLRMEAPVPGKRVIGLEVPNGAVSMVSIRELLESDEFQRLKSRLRLALGRDVSGRPVVGDLARMPHLLIAGATGSGKSVCVNSIIASLLVQSTPDELQVLMIDPKMVELIGYGGIPHLRMPVVTDMDHVVGALKWAVREMERRYSLFSSKAARNLEAFNRGAPERGEARLPFLVLVIDELADMMMTAPDEVERTLCRLAQLGRAAGIHLVVATQRPSVDVLTGLIKANFVTRIAFAVSSQVDSRVILDTAGAEKLLGRGDMLYVPPDSSKPIRLQGAYVSDQEIQDLVTFWQRLGGPRYDEGDVRELAALGRAEEAEEDELYARAAELARQYARVSVSLLQRRLGIGYPRAARLLDLLEERSVVGPPTDGKSREVLARAEGEG